MKLLFAISTYLVRLSFLESFKLQKREKLAKPAAASLLDNKVKVSEDSKPLYEYLSCQSTVIQWREVAAVEPHKTQKLLDVKQHLLSKKQSHQK